MIKFNKLLQLNVIQYPFFILWKLLYILSIVCIFVTCSSQRQSSRKFTSIDQSYFDYHFQEIYDDFRGPNVPYYTPDMVAKHAELALELPWVQPVASANKKGIIGRIPGWQKNPDFPEDPVIPSQNMYGYQIRDLNAKGPKVKIIVTSGNHPTEYTGNWVLEGMVNFLCSSDPIAVAMRTMTIFYFYPDVNPVGRYMAVNNISLAAAPDTSRFPPRGNPELYLAGESDHNRVWETNGKFSTVDMLKAAWKKDLGNQADYLWDMHGPQTPGNWRATTTAARTNDFAKALMKREPEVIRCGPESGFKINVASGPPGKLSLYATSEEGLKVTYVYVYEPGALGHERLRESGKNLVLAFYDILTK